MYPGDMYPGVNAAVVRLAANFLTVILQKYCKYFFSYGSETIITLFGNSITFANAKLAVSAVDTVCLSDYFISLLKKRSHDVMTSRHGVINHSRWRRCRWMQNARTTGGGAYWADPAHFLVLMGKPYCLSYHFLLLRNLKKNQLPAFLQQDLRQARS